MNYRILVVKPLILILMLSVQSVRADENADAIRVACIGDSITYGATIKDRERNCYPSVLGRLLGSGYEVRNFGVNGATLLKKGDKPYWKLPAFRQATAFEPQIAIIKLGTNDTKPRNWRHAADFTSDLATLIDHFASLSSRPRIWVCLPAPVHRDRWGINEATIKGEVIPRIRKVAAEKKVPVIDLYSALRDVPEQFPDGVHPDAQGAQCMATTIHRAITTELKAPRHVR